MTDDLSEIKGVGPESATDLADEGFDTIDDIATAEVSDVTDAEGFGESRAEDIIANAQAELEEDSTDDEDESEEIDETVETYDVDVEADRYQLYHIAHIVLEEATRQQQSTAIDLRNDAYSLHDKLMAEVDTVIEAGTEIDETVEFTLACTPAELNAFARALSQGVADYRSRAGITSLYACFDSIKTSVSKARQRAMEV